MTGDPGSRTLLTEHHAKPGNHIPSAAPHPETGPHMSGAQWRAGAQAPQAASVTFSFVPQEENSQDRILRPVCLARVLTVPTLAQPPSPLALFSRWK